MLPLSGRRARSSILDRVVLPQPLSPTRPRHSPRFTVKLTSSTASTVPAVSQPSSPALRIENDLLTCSTCSNGPPPAVSCRVALPKKDISQIGRESRRVGVWTYGLV